MLKSGSRKNRRPGALACLLTLVFNLCLSTGVYAQPTDSSPVTVGRGDILQLSVPGHPEYELDLTVGNDGRVEIPGIGGMLVADLTKAEAILVIRQKLRFFDPTINNINISLGKSGSITIHVIGQVANPGSHEFFSQPSFWGLMRTVGGPTATANLAASRIVREEYGQPTSLAVDLSDVMHGQNLPDMELRNGDTLVIPALVAGAVVTPTSKGVQVFGGVVQPTIVVIKEPTPLLDVLMMAGSPNPEADLKEIFWVHQEGAMEFRSTMIDLQKFIETGDPVGNPLIYPGDSVQVSVHSEGWVRRNVPFIVTTLAAVMTAWLAYDRLSE